jgi:hypothetical protein
MADWSSPGLGDLKVDVLTLLKERDVDAITLAESPTNPPTGAKRWVSASNKFQTWNGSAWVDLVIAIESGGTGGTTQATARTGLGLGTMSTQNSNAVSISGGALSGLTSIESYGNAAFYGILSLGSIPTIVSASNGQILESAIEDGTVFPRLASNELIEGTWTFGVNLGASGAINLNSIGGGTKSIYFQNAGISIGKIRSVNTNLYLDADVVGIRTAAESDIASFSSTGLLLSSNLTLGGGQQIRADYGTLAAPGISFSSDANTGIRNVLGADYMEFVVGGVAGPQMYLVGGTTPTLGLPSGCVIAGDLVSSTHNNWDIGSTGVRWKNIYLVNAPIVTSDERLKRNHGNIEGSLELLRGVNPYVASWKSDNDNFKFPTF